MSRIILTTMILWACFSGFLYADDILGIGVHLGGQHDVGKLSDQESGMQTDPQNNLLAGISLKANMSFVFLRTGIDTTFLLNKGKVYEDSSQIKTSKLEYTAIPGFLGLRFPVKDMGEFYMGGGAAYFLGSGQIVMADGTKEEINTTALGYGFITGIEFTLVSSMKIYMEWEYIDARSGAVMKTQTTYGWKNLHIDYTGHRILFGVMYYLI